MCCREQIVTLADHWRAPNTSHFDNQTQIADEMESQRVSCSPQFDRQIMMTQINQLEVMQTRHEDRLASKDNSTAALQIGLANSLCNGVTGMLRCTVSPELTFAPFPHGSISQLELANNLLRPQSTLVLSTGEANLGAHNFSNQRSPNSVIEAKAEATRLLGQGMRCIQLPMEIMSTQTPDGPLLARLLDSTSLEVGHETVCLSHLYIIFRYYMALAFSSMTSLGVSRDRKARMSQTGLRPLPMQHRRLMYNRTILRLKQVLIHKMF